MVLWKLYEDGLGVERDKLTAEYWKLRWQVASDPLGLMGTPHWTVERILLLADLVITGRAERVTLLDLTGTGAAGRQWIELDVAVEEVVMNRRSQPLGDRLRVVVAYSSDRRDIIERDFLNRPRIYPIAQGTYTSSQPAAWSTRQPYFTSLVDVANAKPFAIESLEDVRRTLHRIRELGLDA